MLFQLLEVIRDLLVLLLEILLSIFQTALSTLLPLPRRSLKDEVALVTGAGSGIGREFALQLGQLGARVVCWDVNEENCANTCGEIQQRGGRAWSMKCDVSDHQQVKSVATRVR